MPTFKVELNSKPIKDTSQYKLLIRITVKRERARLSLNYSCTKSQFNPNAKNSNYIKSSHSKYKQINNEVDNKIQLAKDIISDLEKQKKPYTARMITRIMAKPDDADFIAYTDRYIEELKRKGKLNTSKNYSCAFELLKEYNKSGSLSFSEFNRDYVKKLHSYMEDKGLKQSTIHGYFSKIKAAYRKAIDDGLVKQSDSPFVDFKLKEGKIYKDRLTMKEIIRIEELDLNTGSLLWHVRNAFLFSFYCAGIRVSDILLMQWSNIVDGRLVYRMHKTKMDHSLKLKDRRLEILNLYKKPDDINEFIFPFLDSRYDYSNPSVLNNQISGKTALLNKYLKFLATKAEISKTITTHTARHSFADIARQKTDNIYKLSKTLGHSSLKITEAYLASFDEKAVDDTLDEVFKI